jgi:hypothetical protein
MTQITNDINNITVDKIRNYINEYDSIGETLEFGFPHHIKNRIRQRFIDKKKLPNILNMVGTFVQVQSSICPWVYAGENLFPSSPSKSFPRCTLTDVCKGGGYGFNVGALLQGWRLWFQCRCVVVRVEARVQ